MDERARPRRAAARRVEEALLEAAAETFSSGVSSPSVEGIAARAGVARSTAYRHFRDRTSIGLALAERQVSMMREVAGADGITFRMLLHGVLSSATVFRPLLDVTMSLSDAERARLWRTMVDVLTPAFDEARARGELRPGFGPDELLSVTNILAAGFSLAKDVPDRDRVATELLDVVLDGILVRTKGGEAAT